MALLVGCSTAGNAPLVTKIPGDRSEFEIAQVDYSAGRDTARIIFSSSRGILRFDLNPGGRKLRKLTFVVKDQRYCEGFDIRNRSGHKTDLLRAEGVQVHPQGADLFIEITPPAVDVLNDGGRIQYVNQFR